MIRIPEDPAPACMAVLLALLLLNTGRNGERPGVPAGNGHPEKIGEPLRLQKLGNDCFMEGEKKQNHSRGKRRNADIVPGRIPEYDFFLTQGEEEAGESVPEAEAEKRPETGGRKKERNKSIVFFLPE
jgi:hypothetical protein